MRIGPGCFASELIRRGWQAAVIALLMLPAVGMAQAPDTLPEPPRPPRGAKVPGSPPPEPVAPRASPPAPGALPAYGAIVGGPVELYPHVRVKDARKIAPDAVTVVIAVRDPHAGRRGPAGCVFVSVCVPSCPPRKVHANRLGNEVELDYGKYEVDIRSRDGVVTIDYDD